MKVIEVFGDISNFLVIFVIQM